MTATEVSSPTETFTGWLDAFGSALESGDIDGAAALFGDESYWRDLVSFTWNIKTVEGPNGVRDLLEHTLANVQPSNFEIVGEANEADGVTDGWFNFETAVGRGHGQLRIVGGKAFTFLTTLVELKGHEEAKGVTREMGVEHGITPGRKTWLELRQDEEAELGYKTQPYIVIVGGGQGAIGLGARLRRLGVPTIIIEKNPRPGDSWRNRYKSLCLHDPVWYDHLPYMKFPEHWPVFAPKDKLGDWLEMYAKVMELNYWGSTTATSASYDEDAKEWTVNVERVAEDGKTEKVTLRPKQLVMATGMSAKPNIPEISGSESFTGELSHSSAFKGIGNYKGKKAVVLGSNNSAHDICAALWENGADVTMIQRSSTHIARSDTLMELALGDLYSERAVASGVTTEIADLIFASLPYRILHTFQIPVYDAMKEQDAEFYKRLEDAGFMLDFGEDGSGLFMKYLRRGSGYYIDVGASELIANGSVKLQSGVSIEEIKPTSVVLTDGTELDADIIILATGYGSMNGFVEHLMDKEMADKVGKVWGLGSDTKKDPGPWEGEQRNMWKPTQQENLWFHGGNLHQSRHYSQFLSLQLKARYEGIETPVYALQEVHHTS